MVGFSASLMHDSPTETSVPSPFRGVWLEPGHPDYDAACPAFNRRADIRPAVIARCLGRSDVAAAVRHARESGLRIDIRSAGVSVGGLSPGNGMLIDLGLMRAVQVFPDRRVARIEGGVRGGDLQLEAAEHGLAGCTGALSGTGVGLMLGAGIGHLSPRAGYALDNIVSVEVVLATGEVVVASSDENADLFWAVRGAQGTFGVVTALEVRLHEVPPFVHAGRMAWSLDNLARGIELLRASWAWDDALSLLPFIGGTSFDRRGGLELIACHSGPEAQARSDIERLLALSNPDEQSIAPMRFADLHFMFDDWWSPMRNATSQQPVVGFGDELVEALVSSIREPAGGGARLVETIPLRGALGRPPAYPSALRETAEEEPSWSLITGSWWESPSEDQMQVQWVDDVVDMIQRSGEAVERRDPSTVGTVLDPASIARMYGDRFDRLRGLKREWDPENLFVGGHNIPPAQPSA
jgi:FAD/FMN-containing dehydrogenase